MRAPAARGVWRNPLLWAAIAVGTALRSVGLFGQVLIGDEVHAFRFVPQVAFPRVLWAYDQTANSPPLNAWLRLFFAAGIPPSETALRIPVLASGIAVLLIVPWWIARRIDARTAIIAAWLLAVWPPLVLYSRIMRPYMPFVLLGAAAAGAFYEWWRTRRRSAGVAYALLAAAAIYFHLLAAPFVLAPAVFLAVEVLRSGPRTLPPRRDIAIVVGMLTAALLAFVVPAWPDLTALVSARRVPLTLGRGDARAVTRLLCGTDVAGLALIVAAAMLAGAVRLARDDATLLRYVMILSIAQLLAVPLLSPKFVQHGPILARYLIVLAVPAVMLAAIGLAARTWIRRVATPLLMAALFFSGPLASASRFVNPLGMTEQLAGAAPRTNDALQPLPDAYRLLATGPPGPIIEHPFPPSARFLLPLTGYWEVHRRPIRIAPARQGLGDPRLGLRSIVAGDPQRLLDSDAVFLIVHRDWQSEIGRAFIPDSGPVRGRRLVARNLEWMRAEATHLDGELERSWGPPDASDAQIAIWDLTRVRARQGR